jgi:hypothetical protein
MLYPGRVALALSLFLLLPGASRSQSGDGGLHASIARPAAFTSETLYYTVEWRLITAGTAKLRFTPSGTAEYPSLHSELDLESTGMVSKLYKVEDKYFGNYDPGFCAISSQMTANEGRRRRESSTTYDRTRNKASYLERDLVKNVTVKADEIDVPNCVHDVVGALLALRNMRLDLGKSVEIPISDGKKSVSARIEAQEREDVKINNTTHKTIRYEAFLFNNVLYAKKARLHIWLTDDAKRTPVQIRIRMNFPVGTITLTLDKTESS